MRTGALLLLSLMFLSAQTKQERGRQVIDATLAALGGPRFLAMEDRVETGRAYSFYREELSGLSRATIYTRYRRPSDPRAAGELLSDERQSFGKNERSGAVLFAGGQGHEITFRGARPVAADRLERYRDTALHNIFYILRERLGEPGLIIEYRGADIVDNLPVYSVDITDEDNRTVTVYIHQSSKLPARQIYYRRDPQTRERREELTIFGKYRDVGGGVQWPYDVQRLRDGERLFQMYADSVEVNTKLPGSLFELPSGIRILKQMK
ncbi:MAG: hypothetical protein ABSD56_03165 [Bryobacteraceae bacterium]